MPEDKLIIGSRGSDLALWQANTVADALRDKTDRPVNIKIIKTEGDRVDQLAFDKMEGKGFFTREIEQALLNGEIDIAVHSLKDLPTCQPDGLTLGAVGMRADRREMLLIQPKSHTGKGVISVSPGGIIGTSSARRKSQIAFHNSELVIRDLRGNVPTRVKKLREGLYDAIVIAAAGIERLNLDLNGLVSLKPAPELFLPAPAQGVLGVQVREDDDRVIPIVSTLNDAKVVTEVSLERGLLACFDGGCSLPLGVYSEVTGSTMRLVATLGSDHGQLKRAEAVGDEIEAVVSAVYHQLVAE